MAMLAPILFPLALLSSGGPISARTAAQEPAVSADAVAPDDAQDLRRVLHLDDGSIVRARSRRTADGWEIREGPEWHALDGVVVRTCGERELLAESRRREAGLDTKTTNARVDLARWMLGEGLQQEALVQLDRELRRDPDSRAVLELLREAPITLETDPGGERRATADGGADELAAWITFGAGASPAHAEAAVARIANFESRVDLEELVRAELLAPQPQRREFATLLARRMFPKALVSELARRAMLDAMGSVRLGAAQAMRAADDVAVLAPAIDALASKTPAVRNNAVEALGVLAHPAAVEPLVAHLSSLAAGGGAPSGTRANIFLGFQTTYVMDYDLEIAQGASIADPIIAVQSSGVILDARSVVQITREVELLTTVHTLQKITLREDLKTPADWQAWWRENGAAWQSAKLASEGPRLLSPVTPRESR
jgi:hypothetical protein